MTSNFYSFFGSPEWSNSSDFMIKPKKLKDHKLREFVTRQSFVCYCRFLEISFRHQSRCEPLNTISIRALRLTLLYRPCWRTFRNRETTACTGYLQKKSLWTDALRKNVHRSNKYSTSFVYLLQFSYERRLTNSNMKWLIWSKCSLLEFAGKV